MACSSDASAILRADPFTAHSMAGRRSPRNRAIVASSR